MVPLPDGSLAAIQVCPTSSKINTLSDAPGAEAGTTQFVPSNLYQFEAAPHEELIDPDQTYESLAVTSASIEVVVGSVTVIVTLSDAEQPDISPVAVNVYTVVTVGVAVGVAIDVELNPSEGLHK